MNTFSKFAIAISATFTTAISGVGVIGYLNSPQYRDTKAARYVGTPDQIVSYLTEFDTGPSRRGEIKTSQPASVTENGNKRWDQTTANGAKLHYDLVSENTSQRLAVVVQSASFGMTVTWNYTITPVSPTVSEVNIEELLHVQNSWIRGIIVLTGRNAQLKQEHRHLADQFELGN